MTAAKRIERRRLFWQQRHQRALDATTAEETAGGHCDLLASRTRQPSAESARELVLRLREFLNFFPGKTATWPSRHSQRRFYSRGFASSILKPRRQWRPDTDRPSTGRGGMSGLGQRDREGTALTRAQNYRRLWSVPDRKRPGPCRIPCTGEVRAGPNRRSAHALAFHRLQGKRTARNARSTPLFRHQAGRISHRIAVPIAVVATCLDKGEHGDND
jgi:hypothetical protein